jgi:hypothetical protein
MVAPVGCIVVTTIQTTGQVCGKNRETMNAYRIFARSKAESGLFLRPVREWENKTEVNVRAKDYEDKRRLNLFRIVSRFRYYWCQTSRWLLQKRERKRELILRLLAILKKGYVGF